MKLSTIRYALIRMSVGIMFISILYSIVNALSKIVPNVEDYIIGVPIFIALSYFVGAIIIDVIGWMIESK